MSLKVNCIRAAFALMVLAAGIAQARADEAEDVYSRTLRGTGLILTPTGSGTGWVVDLERGLLVTNHHVVTSQG